MLQYIIWGISFITLWLTIIWLNFLYAEKSEKRVFRSYPKISFGIPAYNEEATIERTLSSLIAADYPRKQREIIVVDDGSKDKTAKVVREFIKEHPRENIRLVCKKNGGKASALNEALKRASGEFFAVMDADSRISVSSVKTALEQFSSEKIGAVISRIRVDNAVTLLERLQRIEYIMSSMIRRIMCNFGTLSMTPGVLSVYRMDVLRKVGGFTKDRENLTEDLEIAMRLKYHGFSIGMAQDSVTYTHVPSTFAALWRQRIRWARGYWYNHVKYRKMILSKKHGLFGTFQMPLNVVAVVLLIANIGLISFDMFNRGFDFVFRSLTIPDYFMNQMTSWPSLTEFILARNIQVYLPLIIATVLGAYLIVYAHRLFKEQFRNQMAPLLGYMILMPYFAAVNWIASIAQEVSKSKRKW